MSTKETARLQWADMVRGIAIFFVALGHSPLVAEPIKVWIYSFHMPIFFFVSGFFLLGRETDYLTMVKKKAYGLLPLYFVVSLGGVVMESLIARSIRWDSLVGVFICQFGKYDGYLWFFPALFGLQCILLAFWKHFKSEKAVLILCCVLAAVEFMFWSFTKVRLPWHLDVAFLLAPYSGLGIVYRKYYKSMESVCMSSIKHWLLIASLLTVNILFCASNIMGGAKHIDYNLLRTNEIVSCYIAGAAGIAFLILFIRQLPELRALSFVGRYSAVYYCLSFIGSRFIIPCLAPVVNLTVAMILFWIIPVPVVMVLRKWFPWLLGIKT